MTSALAAIRAVRYADVDTLETAWKCTLAAAAVLWLPYRIIRGSQPTA